MGLETGSNISDLVVTNPLSSDAKSFGDDHFRLVKTVLRNNFAGFTGNILVSGTDGGAADAYTLTPATTLTAYSTKMIVEFTPNATNTGAATLNISGLGAKNIYSVAGVALSAGELVSGGYYLAAYDGTQFRLLSVSKAYIDGLAVAAGNVPAGGTTNQKLAKNSATDYDMSWVTDTSPGLVLIATLTPSVSANLDFLTTFTSTYDSYLIVGQGLKPATITRLVMRLANSGTADSGSNYYFVTFKSSTSSASALIYLSTGDTLAAGKGINFAATISGVNSASEAKRLSIDSITNSAATPTYVHNANPHSYVGGAVSGLRLYWESGANFSAVGTVRVYGYSNT